mgnify:CR=1 FL=1
MQDDLLSQSPKINLHIHSRFSDGANSVDMIVERALKLQFDCIALTDHFSNSWKAGVIKTLDTYKKIDIYLKTLEEQNIRLRNLNANLTVLKGIEIDLGSKFDYITKLITPSRFDLILLEYLNSPETLEFARKVLETWKEKSNKLGRGFPILGLAHFDPSYFIYNDLDLLFDFLKEYSIYYEFNSAYSKYYAAKYREVFEKIKEYGIPVGVGADAHQMDGLNYIADPLEKIEYYGLTENFQSLIKTLESL